VQLEDAIASIETRLAALGGALRDRNAAAVESHAQELQRALAGAVQRFSQATRQPGGVPPALRQRLAAASGQVAAQRESLARATAALDRAIDVLMPHDPAPPSYGPQGNGARWPSASPASASA
jgi:ABC-type transporter Mla subunit MlaD